MENDNQEISQEIIDIATEIGLVHSKEVDRVFYLPVKDKSEEIIEEIKNKAESAGFFFNGFGSVDEESAVEFVYNN